MAQIIFTDEEINLLAKWGRFYNELDTGVRKPTTNAQEHFVKVCRFQAKAETIHEIAWIKKKREAAYELQSKHETQQRQISSGIPDFEEGTPRPGWFTDQDLEKMRKQDYSDMVQRNK